MTNWLIRTFVKGYDNPKDPAVHARYGRLAGAVGIICNLLLAGGKLVAGLLSGSLAIMADAVNNLSDAASSIITLAGFKLAAKPADAGHPFGHARFEYIGALAVAVMVLVVGVELGKGSVEKIIAPAAVDYSVLSLAILAASIGVKLWMAAFNRGVGRRIGSVALEATFADSRNDVIATSAVLAAALAARFTGFALDGWMGAGVAVFIIVSGIGLLRDTLSPLLGAAPDPELVEGIQRRISTYPGVLGTHDLIVHDYGPGRRFASAHVEMDSGENVMDSHAVIDRMERDFLERDNLHLIVHYDPVDTSGSREARARARVLAAVRGIDERLTLHDFNLAAGRGHTNYFFDVVVPPGFEYDEAALTEKIAEALGEKGKKVHLHITVDDSYAPIP